MVRIETHEETYTDRRRFDGRDDRSLGDLIRDLRDESSHLLRQEVALAKAEMSEKASRVGRNTGYLTAGGAALAGGLLFLALAATVGIYNGLVAAEMSRANAGWLAPLMTGLVIAVIGYALIQKGISALQHESPMPERTVDSIQENAQWAKEKVTK